MTAAAQRIAASVERIRATGAATPELAIVLGSGWDDIAATVERPIDVAYRELPAFASPGVAGHAGSVRLGRLAGRPVALLRGRRHVYEDGDASAMNGAIRTLAALGCRAVVLTNAAGSLDPALPPGATMLVSDHLNLTQRTPLLGESGDERFVDLVDAYSPVLRAQARAAAAAAGLALHEGVYAWMLGPQFETPAEVRMLRLLGARAVGMSTVPETIVARHAGLDVLALSLITNYAAGLGHERLTHGQTLAVAQANAQTAARLLAAIVVTLRPIEGRAR